MFCVKCNAENDDNAVFCTECGEKISGAENILNTDSQFEPKEIDLSVSEGNNNMFFCENCGTKLEEGAVFCGSCGESISSKLPTNSASTIQDKLNISLIKKKGMAVFLSIFAGVIVVAAIVVMLIINIISSSTPLIIKNSMSQMNNELKEIISSNKIIGSTFNILNDSYKLSTEVKGVDIYLSYDKKTKIYEVGGNMAGISMSTELEELPFSISKYGITFSGEAKGVYEQIKKEHSEALTKLILDSEVDKEKSKDKEFDKEITFEIKDNDINKLVSTMCDDYNEFIEDYVLSEVAEEIEDKSLEFQKLNPFMDLSNIEDELIYEVDAFFTSIEQDFYFSDDVTLIMYTDKNKIKKIDVEISDMEGSLLFESTKKYFYNPILCEINIDNYTSNIEYEQNITKDLWEIDLNVSNRYKNELPSKDSVNIKWDLTDTNENISYKIKDDGNIGEIDFSYYEKNKDEVVFSYVDEHNDIEIILERE